MKSPLFPAALTLLLTAAAAVFVLTTFPSCGSRLACGERLLADGDASAAAEQFAQALDDSITASPSQLDDAVEIAAALGYGEALTALGRKDEAAELYRAYSAVSDEAEYRLSLLEPKESPQSKPESGVGLYIFSNSTLANLLCDALEINTGDFSTAYRDGIYDIFILGNMYVSINLVSRGDSSSLAEALKRYEGDRAVYDTVLELGDLSELAKFANLRYIYLSDCVIDAGSLPDGVEKIVVEPLT